MVLCMGGNNGSSTVYQCSVDIGCFLEVDKMIECHKRRHPAELSYVAVMSDPARVTEAYEEHQQYKDKLFWLAMICWTLTALVVVALA